MVFSEPSDACLGRILAGLNPNTNSFGALPPNFAIDNPTQDEYLSETMNKMHGSIIVRLKDSTSNTYGILLIFLAAIVHHKNLIRECFSRNANHSFLKIIMIHDSNLMSELKKKISIKPINIVRCSADIPPYAENAIAMHELIQITTETLVEVKN